MKTLTAIEFCFENTDVALYSKKLSSKIWASVPKALISVCDDVFLCIQHDDQNYSNPFIINSNLLTIDDWELFSTCGMSK